MSRKSRKSNERAVVALAKAIAKMLYGHRLDTVHDAVAGVHSLIGRSIADLESQGTPPDEVCLGELFEED